MQRRDAARRVGHGHGLAHLGRRATARIHGDEDPRHEQRRRHFDRGREPGVEFRVADGGAGGGADAPVAEFGGGGRDDGDGRGVRRFGLSGRYVQHELSGGGAECRWRERQLQLNERSMYDLNEMHAVDCTIREEHPCMERERLLYDGMRICMRKFSIGCHIGNKRMLD